LAMSGASRTETIPPTSRKLLIETGYQHVSAGQYQLAMACYAEALRVDEARGSNNRPAIASDLNDLLKRHAGPDDPRTAKALAHGAEPRRALLWSRRSAVYCA